MSLIEHRNKYKAHLPTCSLVPAEDVHVPCQDQVTRLKSGRLRLYDIQDFPRLLATCSSDTNAHEYACLRRSSSFLIYSDWSFGFSMLSGSPWNASITSFGCHSKRTRKSLYLYEWWRCKRVPKLQYAPANYPSGCHSTYLTSSSRSS